MIQRKWNCCGDDEHTSRAIEKRIPDGSTVELSVVLLKRTTEIDRPRSKQCFAFEAQLE